MRQRPTPDEMPTAYFATAEGGLVIGNDTILGVAIPSSVTPGATLICLRLDLLDKLREPATAGDSSTGPRA